MRQHNGWLDLDRELAAIGALDVFRQPYVNSAYATGSLLAGLGTRTSDIDAVLLVDREESKLQARRDKATRRHDPSRSDWAERVDFQVFTVDEFTEFVDTCTDFDTIWDAGRMYTTGPALRVLSQFAAAAHVLKPSADLDELARRLATHHSSIVRLAVMHTVLYANNTHEDLVGLIAEDDTPAVLRLSHRHLEFGLDAWCTAFGPLYPDVKFKWLWRRMRRGLPEGPELDALCALYLPEGATEQPPDIALRRLDTTQALLTQALLAAWANDPQAYRVPVLSRWEAEPESLWRSADWMPIRTSTMWRLGADFRFLRVSLTSAVAWACAGGRPADELETMVIDRCRVGHGIDVGPAEVRAAIDDLLECGALRRGRFPAETAG